MLHVNTVLKIMGTRVQFPSCSLMRGGKIILKWIFGKKCGKVWTGCIWIRIRTN